MKHSIPMKAEKHLNWMVLVLLQGSNGEGVITADEKRLTHELDSPLTIHEIISEDYETPQELQGSSVLLPQELNARVKGEKHSGVTDSLPADST